METLSSDGGDGVSRTERQRQRLNSLNSFPALEKVVESIFVPIGFEAYPFHVGWYNDLVDPKFRLDFPYNTVAIVVISGPDTFEKCIIPFIRVQLSSTADYTTFDPLDESMRCIFRAAKQKLVDVGFEPEVYHDFDMYPNRRPKVLVQTAAHVAGAVEYFHRDRLKIDSLENFLHDSKLFGVAIHPEFGGWFAIRGVIVLQNVVLDETNAIPRPLYPTIQVKDEGKVVYLLEQFGLHWKTHVWRDILPRHGHTRYSAGFIGYLGTEPGKRWDFLKNNNYIP